MSRKKSKVQSRSKPKLKNPRKKHVEKHVWRAKFFKYLAKYSNESYACEKANVSKSTVRDLRATDEEFAEQYEFAMQAGDDRIKLKARRMALRGSVPLLKFIMGQMQPVQMQIGGIPGGDPIRMEANEIPLEKEKRKEAILNAIASLERMNKESTNE